MRKIRLLLTCCMVLLFSVPTHAGQMVNVEYIHKLIEQQWGVWIPYNPAIVNPKIAANMEYLLGMVDITNKELNRHTITGYQHTEYATKYAADTDASIAAVSRLVKIEPKFFITTTDNTSDFEFSIGAAGTFMVDWGDGKKDKILRPHNTTLSTYTHTYDAPGKYEISIGGRATAYYYTVISFSENLNISKIRGSLGEIFPAINTDSGPKLPEFANLFKNCTNLDGPIPEKLFAGIRGQPRAGMFASTFEGCTKLNGEIPAGLFGELVGVPQYRMFEKTFSGCKNISGKIPPGLFGELSGNPAGYMFSYTFNGCEKLSGEIPSGLFGDLTGAPATGMFQFTFADCAGLTDAIPSGLFGNISGNIAVSMFAYTFSGCVGLSGEIPSGLFGSPTGAPQYGMFDSTFRGCYGLTGSIPSKLFGTPTGAPAAYMFDATFSGCHNLDGEIPADLFGNISGDAVTGMFFRTFYNCTNLTGPSARINGTPLYEIWSDIPTDNWAVRECYYGDLQLSDYDSVPAEWR
ncbi:hypothetical protein HDR61_03705 [bacterium]|nr:hypothetical protein [bacterium]